jgi:capsular polysaccharide export protein
LTQDAFPLARRQRALSLDELVAGVLILYPTYVSRRSGHFTTPERALEELQQWRDVEGGVSTVSWQRRVWRLALRWGQRWRRQWGADTAKTIKK